MLEIWQATLSQLVKNSQCHGRFLNTLSLMEYMGARKIIKSQKEEAVSIEVLTHAAEEIRHAQVFKKLALKVSGGELTTYRDDQLLAGTQARNYIQTVDLAICEALKGENSYLNYLLSTLLIEERANQVYPYYAQLLAPLGLGRFVENILKEEEIHLEEIQKHLLSKSSLREPQLAALRMLEQQAFDDLIQGISMEMQAHETLNELFIEQ